MKKMVKDIFSKLIFSVLKTLINFIVICHFLPERMKTEKVKELVANLHGKIEYVIHIRNLKQALNRALIFLKVIGVIKLNQNAWLKSYIDMKTDLRKKAKNDFEKRLI